MGDSGHGSSSDRGNLLLKKMEQIYQCPVCLSLPLCNINQCLEGHLICVDCYTRMPAPVKCPTCKIRLSAPPIRCRAAEQAIEYVDLPCKFSEKGCKQVGARSIMHEHISQCKFRNIECPHWPCKEMVTYGEVVDHLKNTHWAKVFKTCKVRGVNQLDWPDQQRQDENSLPGIVFIQGHTFFLNTVEPACMVHGCKVNPLVWSIFGWSRTEWTFY